ncbi:ATPase [Halothiobacillus diazotrophicus]|uniref:Iron-sulfur cluster carrier protein n=1 Tax=Halothiobacillus diazotrophicus TaxID=1860122 RepID=A0A191ZJ77_9GAMM|nr:iron-sulfur cluster carrier protein ApbC [Halothiobacillus diazotrophicus]ANJ67920.1 ATPase [Halothiobacillus diazotrophicus]
MGLFGNKADPTKSAALKAAIGALVDPHSGESLATAQAVERAEVRGDQAEVDIVLDYPAAGWEDELVGLVQQVARTVEGVRDTKVTVAFVSPLGSQLQGKAMPGVRNIIAVASGKGGVGKSTTSVNLALALAAEGARVGLLDADIYGPSQPKMLGVRQEPEIQDDRSMKPVMAHGLQTMSIGYLVEDDTAMIWRGPMVTSALMQLLNDTRWDQLDYLIIDMPPGTGDIQITLAQKVPVAGSVIVTTPQDIALLDARKAISMFEKVNVPVLGIVENMALHVCSNCGHIEHIFGAGGGARLAADNQVELLGSLPLDLNIRTDVDEGLPTVVRAPDSPIARAYRETARRLAAALGRSQRTGVQDHGPLITIEE